MANKDLKFRISAALKDIIGRDLITDDFIAVFELVKNSFDAYATNVDLIFENIYQGNARIIIKDNGKGMNYYDLVNKWLFVAYSAKTEGTEDDSYDYRNNIYGNRPFAGAKGIGRFSCDKLGKSLYLETKKQEDNAKTEVLTTNWEDFENNIKEEFVDVAVWHETKDSSSHGLNHGTVLVISDLRAQWNRTKLLRLKDSLAKLINPNAEKSKQRFKITIDVKEEVENDEYVLRRKGDDPFAQRETVNGEVRNFIFEELGLKTTKIESEISANGKFVTTTLFDGGTLIYRIKEENRFDLLHQININLYYLNRSAKLTFAKRMGLAAIRFGHIFLYKNGFRIFPFGEPYEDPLKINVRKSRKRNSTLGTGELMGQIDIVGENPYFKETSSRGDGLIKNPTYYQLEEFLISVLERIEKYVIDVQQWGLSVEDEDSGTDLKERITKLIGEITGSTSILEFDYPENFLELITNAQHESAEAVINNLNRIAVKADDDELAKIAKQASTKLGQIQSARRDAEIAAQRERESANRANAVLKETQSENLFLKSVKSQDFDEIVSFMHSIGISASTIDNYLSGIYQKIGRGIEIKPQDLKKAIEVVSFENRKIITISRFSTKANFKLYAEDVKLDIIEFIKEYIFNILIPLRSESIKIDIYDAFKNKFERTFKPIEVSTLFDNLVSNSIRAKATAITIDFAHDFYKEKLKIIFSDNGIGIPAENIDKIFNFGFTTTSGSGLGLFHVQQIIKKLKADIDVKSTVGKGAQFIINF